ncbi:MULTISPECIES: hypothetical protein [unclassified Streptomyces]|uniref:hypothetical protein n=1 Tax=unclassified Streptomyces TaxID=2593676 RepID=UPI000CD5821F|nr:MULTISPECIES: hypothetical protein [unclassified Streptomyces]
MRRRPWPDGYWCETVVRSPDAGGEWHLGGHWAHTPDAALQWLRGQALRLADALEPLPGHGPFPDSALHAVERPGQDGGHRPGQLLRDWAADTAYHHIQCRALTSGRPISANTRGPDRICGFGEVEVFYSLSARPIRRDAATRRLLRAL